MKNKHSLLLVLVAAFLMAWPATAMAFIGRQPPTLGELCRQADYIYALRVEKFSRETGVIVFKPAQELKTNTKLADGVLAKHVIGWKDTGSKIILDWAGEGKTAVLFGIVFTPRGGKPTNVPGCGYVYIDKYWYLAGYDAKRECWTLVRGDPAVLAHYCGTPEALVEAVPRILQGEVVVVSAMVGGNKEDLEKRTGKIREIRVSLKPDLAGKITALSDDGKQLTLLPDPTTKERTPAAIDVKIADGTRIIAIVSRDTVGLAVGQYVRVWLEIGDERVAATVQIGRPR